MAHSAPENQGRSSRIFLIQATNKRIGGFTDLLGNPDSLRVELNRVGQLIIPAALPNIPYLPVVAFVSKSCTV